MVRAFAAESTLFHAAKRRRGIGDHAAIEADHLIVEVGDGDSRHAGIFVVRRVHAHPDLRGAVGVVIQSYLYRSQADVEQLLADGIRVRLCKGAYNEPPEVAFPIKAEVDSNFFRLAKMLIDSPIYHAIATHDEVLVGKIKAYAMESAISPSHFEFQMLYGVRRDLQRKLVGEGYKVRVYVPFGTEWYPYFMRRLAERPANLLFMARNFFRS